MSFNQDLEIPEAFRDRRRLGASGRDSDLDIQHVVKVRFQNNNDLLEEEENDGLHPYSLIQWSARGLEIKVDFEEPLTISKGKQQDVCIVKIIRPEMFKVEGST